MAGRELAESAAAAWIARRESGGWTQADQEALEAWIASETDHRVAWLRLSVAWDETNRLKTLRTDAVPGNVPKPDELRSPFFGQEDGEGSSECAVEKRVGPGLRGLARPRRRVVAAAVLLVCAGAVLWRLLPSSPAYETDIGAVEAVPLADGSRVTLNTDTRIKVDLSQSERRVNLARGEAYFEVAKDPTRPFVVDVGDKRVVAVGTSFSVRRDEADGVRVFVTEGSVRVDRGEGADSAHSIAQLQSGAIAHAVADDVIVQTRPVAEVEQMLTWRTGYLVFDHTPLSEAVAEFNRYNRRKILIADPQIAAIRIGGNFRATNVEAFLRLVESDFPVVATERGRQITLTAVASGSN
jgi:transmembrane sensor